MTDHDYSENEIREMDTAEYRKKLPSGWMELARYESIVLMLDALLESPPSREFTDDELAEKAGISPKSANTHMESIVELGVINKLEDGREEARYSLNERSPITQKLFSLNKVVEEVKSGNQPESLPDRSRDDNKDFGNESMLGDGTETTVSSGSTSIQSGPLSDGLSS